MEKEKRNRKWQNGKLSEEYEVHIYDYKGEPIEVRTGKCKKYENDGTLKEECDYEITKYHDKKGNSFYGHSKKTNRHYNSEGELMCTEIWVPEYNSPYGGPCSLHSFNLKERIEH